jgi:hypothetical protein
MLITIRQPVYPKEKRNPKHLLPKSSGLKPGEDAASMYPPLYCCPEATYLSRYQP